MSTSPPPPPPLSQPHPELSLKERFFRSFQNEVTALHTQIDRLSTTSWTDSNQSRSEAVDACLASIDRLSLEVKDAASYIPAYDQRACGKAIKSLGEKLQSVRSEVNPPKKFQFKSARKNNAAIPTPDAAKESKPVVSGHDSGSLNASNKLPTNPSSEQTDTASAAQKISSPNANTITISDENNAHILAPETASPTSSGTVTNIRRSVIDLTPPTINNGPYATLTLKNIQGSLIICGQVAGPIHITGVENSVLVTPCRQFRMHASKNVDVYLHTASRPIIEDCERIRFAPLPEAYITPSIASTQNRWDQIDDFKWLKSEPSPHFSLLQPSDRIKSSAWADIRSGEPDVGSDAILEAVGVRS